MYLRSPFIFRKESGVDNMLPVELKEFIHNLKNHDYNASKYYRVYEDDAKKVIAALELIDDVTTNIYKICEKGGDNK